MKRIGLLAGPEHFCSYLPDRIARSLYADTGLKMSVPIYSRLAEQGFRRSGDLVYRPHCRACRACVPMRIPVNRFVPDRSQLRNFRRNGDLEVIGKPARLDDEHYQLFQNYLTARHADGDMADSSPEDYIGFLGSQWAETIFFEFRRGGDLLAVAVVDRLDLGLSAVYTFFDPDQARRGLGTFAVLWQIGEARRLGLEWLYLGYWIGDCRKMTYKQRYRPLEAFVDGEWHAIEKGEKINP